MMTRKLVLIILGCVLLSFVLATICHLAFPYIIPYTAGEDDASSWRRQIAFPITASAWLSAEVAGLFAIVLASRLWKRCLQGLDPCPIARARRSRARRPSARPFAAGVPATAAKSADRNEPQETASTRSTTNLGATAPA
jgi:hypothetical protein